LGALIGELMPDEAEVWGLLALMRLHDARRCAGVDALGRFVALVGRRCPAAVDGPRGDPGSTPARDADPIDGDTLS
jgi:hypothetical protein